jgi:hypothetical protein
MLFYYAAVSPHHNAIMDLIFKMKYLYVLIITVRRLKLE